MNRFLSVRVRIHNLKKAEIQCQGVLGIVCFFFSFYQNCYYKDYEQNCNNSMSCECQFEVIFSIITNNTTMFLY